MITTRILFFVCRNCQPTVRLSPETHYHARSLPFLILTSSNIHWLSTLRLTRVVLSIWAINTSTHIEANRQYWVCEWVVSNLCNKSPSLPRLMSIFPLIWFNFFSKKRLSSRFFFSFSVAWDWRAHDIVIFISLRINVHQLDNILLMGNFPQ